MSNIFGPIIGDSVAPYALISGAGNRAIGTIYPDVVIDEMHRDEMQITMHPVEIGAPITDHAFRMPAMIEMRAGWSDSSAQAVGYVQEVYQELLALQRSRKLFSVSTGKRQYTNMLLRSLLVRTDETSEFALMTIAVAQEVLLTSVTTSETPAPNTNGSSPVGNVTGSTADDLSAQNAAAAGFATDAQGNVTWANTTVAAPTGPVQLQGAPSAPTWGEAMTQLQ